MKEEQQYLIRQRMKSIRTEMGWRNKDVARVLGCTSSSVKNKFNGSANWTLDDVYMVSLETGYSLDYICGKTDQKILDTTDAKK